MIFGRQKRKNCYHCVDHLLPRQIHRSSKDQFVPDSWKEEIHHTVDRLERRQVRGDFNLYASLLGQCSVARSLRDARRIRALIARDGFGAEIVLANLLVRMFGACGVLDEARDLFARMRPRNIYSYNIMVGAFAQNGHLVDAKTLFDRMPGRSDVSWTAMISAYAAAGEIAAARAIFDGIPEKDRIPWNAMITAYAQGDHCYEALHLLKAMDLEGLQPDNITFISSLNCCSTVGCREIGDQLHDDVVRLGLMPDVSVATACVSMYGRFGRLDRAVEIFFQMPGRNVVSWTTMLAAYAQNGKLDSATDVFHVAPRRNDVTWNALLAAFVQCGQLQDARDVFLAMPMTSAIPYNTLIAALGQRGDLGEAIALFDRLPLPNLVSWNTIIAANAQNGRGEEAISLLARMDLEGVRPNRATALGVLEACSSIGTREIARTVFTIVDGMDCRHHFAIATAIVTMAARCQYLELAQRVFDFADQRDLMLRNSMMYALAQSGRIDAARAMFAAMRDKNTVSYNVVLTMSIQHGLLADAEAIFLTMPDRDVVSCNAMMLGYAQELDLDRAKAIFDDLGESRNLVSWNTMIVALAQNGRCSDAWALFKRFDVEGLRANAFTLVAALESLAGIASLRETRLLHAMIRESAIASPLLLDPSVAAAIINAYGKCGSLADADALFRSTPPAKSMIAWNAIITASAQSGDDTSALAYLGLMQQYGTVPDGVTFLTAIAACSHGGLVDRARGYFAAMREDYAIDPGVDHYTCLIDLLGRSGRLQSAMDLIEAMPFLAEPGAWTALLNACWIHGDLARASHVGDRILALGSREAGPYMLLANVYMAMGEMGKAARVEAILRELGRSGRSFA